MNVETVKHSFGERVIVTTDTGHTVEIWRFDKAGNDHSHDIDEVATHIGGKGKIIIDGDATLVGGDSKEFIFIVHAGELHRMEPDPNCQEPFEWVVSYVNNQ